MSETFSAMEAARLTVTTSGRNHVQMGEDYKTIMSKIFEDIKIACTDVKREHASCYGPFGTERAAEKHLSDNHANPGSSCSNPYYKGYEPDEVMVKLIAEAKERGTYGRTRSYGYRW